MLTSAFNIKRYAPETRAILARTPSRVYRTDAMQLDAYRRACGPSINMFDGYIVTTFLNQDLCNTNIGFGAGSYNLTPSGTLRYVPGYGVTSDGTTGQLLTNITPSTLPNASVTEGSEFVYITDAGSFNHTTLLAGSSQRTSILALNPSGNSSYRVNTANTVPVRGVPTAVGTNAAARGAALPFPGATDFFVYNANGVTRETQAAEALPTTPYCLFPVSGNSTDGLTRSSHTAAAFGVAAVGVPMSVFANINDATARLIDAQGYVSPNQPGDGSSGSSGRDGPGPWDYNTINSVTGIPFLLQQGDYPTSNTESGQTFYYYPLSYNQQTDLTRCIPSVSSATIPVVHSFWGNTTRATTANPVQPQFTWNGPIGVQSCRMLFSTFQNADDATVGAMMWSLGYTLTQIQAECPNITFVPYATLRANPQNYFSANYDYAFRHYYTSVDIMYLPINRLVDLAPSNRWGVRLDAEMQDKRTEQQLITLVQRIASKCHAVGMQFLFGPNAIGNPGATQTGFTVNSAPAIVASADLTTITISFGTGDVRMGIDAQYAAMGSPDPSRILLFVNLGQGNTALNATQNAAIRQAILDYKFRGVYMAPAGGTFGGPLSNSINQSIATICGLPTS